MRGIRRYYALAARSIFIAVISLIALSFSRVSSADILWVDDNVNNLFTVDTSTGSTSFHGNMTGAGTVTDTFTDIAFSPNGELWGLTDTSVYKISPVNASLTFVGNTGITGGNALTFGPDGTLYAGAINSYSLYSINTTTGVATALPGSMGTTALGDLAFAGGQLYLTGNNGQLVRVDLGATVTGTNVGALSVFGVYGLSAGLSGDLLAASYNNIYQVNPSTGALTFLTSYSGFGSAYGSTVALPLSPPDVTTLARLSADVYAADQGADSYQLLSNLSKDYSNTTGLKVNVYQNGDQIVIATRGTLPSIFSNTNTSIYNFLSDTSFLTGTPNPTLTESVSQFASVLDAVHTAYPNAEITLTGHSLGGAISQLVGHYAGIQVVSFDSPGPAQLVPNLAQDINLSDQLTQLAAQNILSPSGESKDYRLYGDQVSLVGKQLTGTQVITVDNGSSSGQLGTDIALYFNPMSFLTYHSMNTLITQLEDKANKTVGAVGFNITPEITLPVAFLNSLNGLTQIFNQETLNQQYLFDPPPGYSYLLQEDPGSPNFQSIELPFFGDISAWDLQYHDGNGWSLMDLLTGPGAFDFGPGVDEVLFIPLDSLYEPIYNPDPFAFGVTFDSDGEFVGTVTTSQVATGGNSVPEPGTLILIVLPLCVLMLIRARRPIALN